MSGLVTDEPCQLFCSDANETVIVPWGEYAADGTPCNVGSRDVCISGICRVGLVIFLIRIEILCVEGGL
jgi:hypothetical protein